MKKASYALIVFSAFIPPLLIALAVEPFGIALSSDSAFYIAMAQNIAHGNGAADFNGHPVALWPPFYPFLIASVQSILSVDPITSGLLINMASHFAIVIFASALICIYTDSLQTAALGATAAAAFFTVFRLSLWLLTETIFILLILLVTSGIHVYISRLKLSNLLIVSV